MGLSRILKTVKSLSSRVAGSHTDRVTDPDSPALVALREELVCASTLPVEIPMLSDVDDTDLMNQSFSAREFSVALGSCNVRSAPGLDGVGYGALLGLSERSRKFDSLVNLLKPLDHGLRVTGFLGAISVWSRA